MNYLETRSVASGSFKVPRMTNALVKDSLSTRGARLLNFLIANEEPIVKVNTMSPYTFRKYCGELRNKFSCQQIAEIIFVNAVLF